MKFGINVKSYIRFDTLTFRLIWVTFLPMASFIILTSRGFPKVVRAIAGVIIKEIHKVVCSDKGGGASVIELNRDKKLIVKCIINNSNIHVRKYCMWKRA